MGASLPGKRYASIEQKYAAAKNKMLEIGFITEGSLSKNYVTCGKPMCRCRKDPAHRHGPYYQLTWKRNGKTVSQAIPKALALQYDGWIRNRQSLSKILKQLYTISQKAIDNHLALKTDPHEKSAILSVKAKLHKT